MTVPVETREILRVAVYLAVGRRFRESRVQDFYCDDDDRSVNKRPGALLVRWHVEGTFLAFDTEVQELQNYIDAGQVSSFADFIAIRLCKLYAQEFGRAVWTAKQR